MFRDVSPLKSRTITNVVESNNMDTMSELIRTAVSSALEVAQAQWIQQLRNGKWGHLDQSSEYNYNLMTSRLDVLQDRLQGIDSQMNSFADKRHVDELHRLAINIEGRLSRLEQKFDNLENGFEKSSNEISTIVSSDKALLQEQFASLVERLTLLESSVESEHETSIELFDLLLKQKKIPRKPQSQTPNLQMSFDEV